MIAQAEELKGYAALRELALDLRWSWNHASDALWERIDAETWKATRNPWGVLRTASRERLSELLADPDFATLLERLVEDNRQAERAPFWYQQISNGSKPKAIAYFSMEFMLSEALPIYSGGLGNVAGDQLKAASDLGVPVVGVGLLYAQGYFRQAIGPDGRQEALYPVNEPDQLPIQPVLSADGEWLRLRIDLPGTPLWIRTWEVKVGRAKLYLLDMNDPANPAVYRCITSQLYGGGPETRLRQEIVLGLAGWKLLQRLGIDPEVCHLNEGHAAFAALERARCFQEEKGVSFSEALAVTRAGNVFTTHTAVKAGFDLFPPDLMRKHFHAYAEKRLGIGIDDLLALGRKNAADEEEPFNMAYLAMHASGAVNGVSALHGAVSRKLFQPLFPRWPEAEVPVGHVTNGIHVPTWDSVGADELWTETCGKERWRGDLAGVGDHIRTVSAARLWQLRGETRRALCEEVRRQYLLQRTEDGEPAGDARGIFDPHALTLGFARRFATYKRPALLLHDPERLARILTNRERPVQLVLAGKAHPQDEDGQELIRRWIGFAKRPELQSRLIFLRDYNMRQAEWLTQGVDVWINTPRRPWEASGTSGMKVLVNGGLNLSELDGWWQEAYAPDIGWAIGDGREHGEDPQHDAAEADTLYRLLEDEVVPEFYERDSDGIPMRWIARIRESMARLTPKFSANRTVREYTEKFYLPAAAAYEARVSASVAATDNLDAWRKDWTEARQMLRFGEIHVEQEEGSFRFSIEVHLGALSPDSIRVEIYADGNGGGPPFVQAASRQGSEQKPNGNYIYAASVPADRAVSDFTPRIVPFHSLARVPLELPDVVWQR